MIWCGSILTEIKMKTKPFICSLVQFGSSDLGIKENIIFLHVTEHINSQVSLYQTHQNSKIELFPLSAAILILHIKTTVEAIFIPKEYSSEDSFFLFTYVSPCKTIGVKYHT